MTIDTSCAALARLSTFATDAAPPPLARTRAAAAILDTVGVTLAGASEPAGRIVQETIAHDGGDACNVIGGSARASATNAALANGTAAHASMATTCASCRSRIPARCWCRRSSRLVSSPPRPARGSLTPTWSALRSRRLGKLMNLTHYQRGWHCMSTLGVNRGRRGQSRPRPRCRDHAWQSRWARRRRA